MYLDINITRKAYSVARGAVAMLEDVAAVHGWSPQLEAEHALWTARAYAFEDELRRYDVDYKRTMATFARDADREFNAALAGGAIIPPYA